MKHLLGAAAAAAALVSVLALPGAVRAHEGDHAIVPLVAFGELPPTLLAPRENVEYVGGHNGFTGGHVVVEGDRLYLGSYGNGLRISDISNPAAPSFLGQYTPGLRADAPPDAAVFDGRHIAVLRARRGGAHAGRPRLVRRGRLARSRVHWRRGSGGRSAASPLRRRGGPSADACRHHRTALACASAG